MTVVTKRFLLGVVLCLLLPPVVFAACPSDTCITGLCDDLCTVEGGSGPVAGCDEGQKCVETTCYCCPGAGYTPQPQPQLRCVPGGVTSETSCENDFDDDGDGATDCDDSECSGYENVDTGSITSHTWTAPLDVLGDAEADDAVFTPKPGQSYYAMREWSERCGGPFERGIEPDEPGYCGGDCVRTDWLRVYENGTDILVGSHTTNDWGAGSPPCDGGGSYDASPEWTWEAGTRCGGVPPKSSFNGDCYVAESCGAGTLSLLKLNQYDNAQAALPSSTNDAYNLELCCPVTDIESSCTTDAATTMRISASENAHAEQSWLGNYPHRICLDPLDSQKITCAYKASCGDGETCIAGMSSSTNAHLQDCAAGSYETRICCGFDVEETYCGDGEVQPPEECDGQSGVPDDQMCNEQCKLEQCEPLPPAEPQCGDSIARNRCDAAFENRQSLFADAFESSMSSYAASLYGYEGLDRRRYKAALYSFYAGNAEDANQMLHVQFGYETQASLLPRDALYLAWMYRAHPLNESNKARTEALLDDYSPGEVAEAGEFLTLAAEYLFTSTKGATSCSAERALHSMLRDRGDNGWLSEQNPYNLQLIVTGLSALLAEAEHPRLQTLAEMNLDLIFARFAATAASGAFGSIRAGDRFYAHPYDAQQAAWYSWSYLLFGTPDLGHESVSLQADSPSLLVGGYCTHSSVRGILDVRVNNEAPDTYELKETTRHGGRSYAYATSDYVLSGPVDVDGATFRPETGYVTAASLRMEGTIDEPYSPRGYMLLTTRVTNSSHSALDAMYDASLYTTRDMILGTLGGSSCREPHVFLGDYAELSHPDFSQQVRIVCYGACSGDTENSIYVMVRMLGGTYGNNTEQRYAPLSNRIPQILDGQEGGRQGHVLFPGSSRHRGVLVVQLIPQSFVDEVSEIYGRTPDLINILAPATEGNTSLEVDEGVIVYKSYLGDNSVAYRYAPGSYVKRGRPGLSANQYRQLSFEEYEPRLVEQVGSRPVTYLGKDEQWRITGYLANQPTYASLDFAASETASMKTASSGTYGCEDTPQEESDGFLPSTTNERLAWLAHAMTRDLGEPHTMDCGTVSEVLPFWNPDEKGHAATHACILDVTGSEKRTVGLLYEHNAPTPVVKTNLERTINSFRLYYPLRSDTQSGLEDDMCSDEAELDTDDFVHCTNNPGTNNRPSVASFLLRTPNYGPMSAWLSPNTGALVISSDDANPFTNGPLDGWADFFKGLFGGGVVEQENENTGAFSKAYFYRDERGRLIDARVIPMAPPAFQQAEIIFENFTSSLAGLTERLPNPEYKKGARSQYLYSRGLSVKDWRGVTAALRPVDKEFSPGADAFQAVCGDGVLDFGEECDPGGYWPRPCDDGVGAMNMTCTDDCRVDRSFCGAVCSGDVDGDDYEVELKPWSDCGLVEDCFEKDPSEYNVTEVREDGSLAEHSCAGIGGAECRAYPFSKCPQCRRPGGYTESGEKASSPDASNEICGDAVDNDCDGWSDVIYDNLGNPIPCPDNSEDGGPEDPVARCETPMSGCPYVCGGEPAGVGDGSPPPSNPCNGDGTCDEGETFDACPDECEGPSGNYGGGPGGCFLGGMLVATPEGWTDIKDLYEGDRVLGYDDATQEVAVAEIVKRRVLQRPGFYLLNGDIRVTGEHPFAVREGDITWKEVRELELGDRLVTQAGEVAVESKRYIEEPVTVYNPAVSNPNTYYVRSDEAWVLVHNKMREEYLETLGPTDDVFY